MVFTCCSMLSQIFLLLSSLVGPTYYPCSKLLCQILSVLSGTIQTVVKELRMKVTFNSNEVNWASHLPSGLDYHKLLTIDFFVHIRGFNCSFADRLWLRCTDWVLELDLFGHQQTWAWYLLILFPALSPNIIRFAEGCNLSSVATWYL